MMRTLLVCALLLASSLSHAATPVTLYGERCANTGECFDVQNDGSLAIDYLQDSCGAGCVAISVNGVRYSSGAGVVVDPLAFQNVVLYAADGRQVTLSADLSKTRALCGKYSCWHYALFDGTLVVP